MYPVTKKPKTNDIETRTKFSVIVFSCRVNWEYLILSKPASRNFLKRWLMMIGASNRTAFEDH